MTNFNSLRRQPYITKVAFENTVAKFNRDYITLEEKLSDHIGNPAARSRILRYYGASKWSCFQLKYTSGVSLAELAKDLEEVVSIYSNYVEEREKVSDDEYYEPFPLDDLIDTYIEYVNLLCAAILLHREDLVPIIHSFIEGSSYDGDDAIIEELLKFYLPERPKVDSWIWDKPFGKLIETIDNSDPQGRSRDMKKYVKGWYSGLKHNAMFWGKHEEIEDSFSPYFGYWAMCAAAFTYLYDIDDITYRDELVYPKDMVDYARSMPRIPVVLEEGSSMLRVLGGQPCPRTGKWFSPAHAGSSRHFTAGDLMPVFENSEYGATIWQWAPGA